jgi:hypothetical protein
MARPRKLSGRILRSIVVAGAMIGTPLVPRTAAAESAMEQATADTAKLALINKQMLAAVDTAAAARSDAGRAKAKAQLDQLHRDKVALDKRLDIAIERLGRELSELDDRIEAANRAKATAKLDQLRKERLAFSERLAGVRPVSGIAILVTCKEALLEKRWTAAADCVERLKFAAGAEKVSEEIRAKATAEAKAELAMRALDETIAAKNLPKAKAELDKIAKDSVYRAEAQAKYDAAVKAQK